MGSWKLLRMVGRGGGSEVYEALTPEGVKVAVKRLIPSADGGAQDLFEAQARLLIRLQHPAVVSVLGYLPQSDAIFGDDRGPCFWMEFVEGRDLLSEAKERDADQILKWFREAAEAFHFLHAQGAIHGDLSPKNLLVDPEGCLKIVDFGGLPADAAAADVATLPYMAPERIDGRALPASDLFSLGTIFYEALAGVHPRAGCRRVSELIRKIPKSLEAAARFPADQVLAARVIDRMIAADPARRFASAEAVLKALEGASAEDAAEILPDFVPLKMIGADAAFAAVEAVLDEVPARSGAVAVHGPAGSGRTRFVREIAFEAALRGIAVMEFTDLHRADAEELARVLASLRALSESGPATGALLIIEWNDEWNAAAGGAARRFFEVLLQDGLVRDVALSDLGREDAARLVEGFLDPDATSAFLGEIFGADRETSPGNPARLLGLLKKLSTEGKIRRRALLPGWKEILEKPREAEPDDPAALSRFLRAEINRLNGLGRYEDALRAAERWFALAPATTGAPELPELEDLPGPLKAVKYWFITGWGHHNLGRTDEAEIRFRRCLQEGKAHRSDPEIAALLARSRSLLGLAALQRNDAPAAFSEFEAALKLQELQPSGDAAGETYRNLARAAAASGDVPGALAFLGRAEDLYRDAGRADGLFWTLLQEGNLFAAPGRSPEGFEKAEAAYARALGLAEKSGSDLKLAVVRNNWGLLDRERGRLASALDLLGKARDMLRYLGNANDVAHNLKELIAAEASVGRWPRAEGFLKELRGMAPSFPEAAAFVGEAERFLKDVREGRTDETPDSLRRLFEALPPELQVTFVDRGDWRRLFSKPSSQSSRQEAPMPPTPPVPEILGALTRLNEDLLGADEVANVLERLMDAAMLLARAESGFLILKTDAPEFQAGLLPGYRVAVARNVSEEEMGTDVFAFSLSAVRRALQSGETVVTDNAVLDPLFREARSVHLKKLKSIVALPVKGVGELQGVFYLDHRFEEGLFEGDLLALLRTFASVASLALQKGRMIEALRENNRELTERVRAQTRELSRSRMILKNEYSDIIGRSPKMVEVLSMVDRITDSKVPVWIYGESGTGKEAVARALHFNSARAKKPFVTENCSALPESLLESELFGHKKGAFTHATADKKGILQYADGGTIFLDEIADMSLSLQAKLLRFLQEGEIRPIGSPEVVRVDVRVVSASNKELPQLVAEGKFREDLFYRLSGVNVRLPPLRERINDLPLLADHFLKRISEREKKELCRLEAGALRILLDYAWPGNVRELQNTLETAALFAEKGIVTAHSLQFKPAVFASGTQSRSKMSAVVSSAISKHQEETSERMEPVLEETLRAIRDNAYHKGYAADALGITRRALYARLRKFGMATDVRSLKTEIEKRLPPTGG